MARYRRTGFCVWWAMAALLAAGCGSSTTAPDGGQGLGGKSGAAGKTGGGGNAGSGGNDHMGEGGAGGQDQNGEGDGGN